MVSFVFSSQQIFTEVYGLGRYFPLAFAAAATGVAIAGFLNSRIVGRVGMRVISHGRFNLCPSPVCNPDEGEGVCERARSEDLNAFLWVSEDDPPEPSAEAPLAGVPLAVKDLFCVQGVPSAAGSRILEGYRPPYTATAVRGLH